MLSYSQKRRIKRYLIFPEIPVYCAMMISFSGIFGLLMIMADGVFLHDENPETWRVLLVECGPAVFYMFVILYAWLAVKLRMKRSRKWRELVKTVAQQNEITEFTDPEYETTITALCADPVKVAEMAHIRPGSVKATRTLIILLPIVFQVALFVPQVVHSINVIRSEQECAFAAIEDINEAFADADAKITYEDPYEDYHRVEYRYQIEFPDTEIGQQHFNLYVTNEGKVDSIIYTCGIDPTRSKEENMDAVKQSMQMMHEWASKEGIPYVEPLQGQIYEFPDEFWQKFEKNSYCDKFDLVQNLTKKTYASYHYYAWMLPDEELPYQAHITLTIANSF